MVGALLKIAFDGGVILILYPVSRSSQGHYMVE